MRRLVAEYPTIASGMPRVSENSWHRRVSGVYLKSMQLAYELISFPVSKETARGLPGLVAQGSALATSGEPA
jgi:hypothetical protein